MFNKKIYTLEGTVTLGVGGVYTSQAQIGNSQRQYKLSSLTWDLRARLGLNPLSDIPINNTNIFDKRLDIETLPLGIPIGMGFDNPTPLGTIQSNGLYCTLYNIGKRNFDNFYFENQLNFILNILNRDQLNVIVLYNSIIIEIEEL
jgi:hypothetical protein